MPAPIPERGRASIARRAACAASVVQAHHGLPETALAEFDIDITGFSPQVAAELNDPDYLDPGKVNRRFIIMTPEQDSLPVVHTSFSNTAALMHEFFGANRRAINAVTIKDALYGEVFERLLSDWFARLAGALRDVQAPDFRARPSGRGNRPTPCAPAPPRPVEP